MLRKNKPFTENLVSTVSGCELIQIPDLAIKIFRYMTKTAKKSRNFYGNRTRVRKKNSSLQDASRPSLETRNIWNGQYMTRSHMNLIKKMANGTKNRRNKNSIETVYDY